MHSHALLRLVRPEITNGVGMTFSVTLAGAPIWSVTADTAGNSSETEETGTSNWARARAPSDIPRTAITNLEVFIVREAGSKFPVKLWTCTWGQSPRPRA